jgi:hypothetical protein
LNSPSSTDWHGQVPSLTVHLLPHVAIGMG